ncbi:AAA family ATPase [Gallaecimonas kandeliae]|uniref:ExeA family protein n=1 Tax=Gallaecimonas kandeliae TaxID=3029055 RepID=UPI002649CDD4|nr:AAA family ATPase [Gallaecimonas kandeliae]WKE65047.1 AAA family ATPase [Gallaecimonas kandeliae]
MPMQLNRVLEMIDVGKSELARAVRLSPATITNLIHYGKWPKSRSVEAFQAEVIDYLRTQGLQPHHENGLFDFEGGPLAGTQGTDPSQNRRGNNLESMMLLRKQNLTQKARQAFGLARDPFGEVRDSSEVFLTHDIRYVRESMRVGAKFGTFMAIVGESGAGKSTLRKDLATWAASEHDPVILIEPYVLGMEESDERGKSLKALHIAEAIIRAVAPSEKVAHSAETRFRQVHTCLLESYRAGNRHVLIIEEAHGLPIATLKHLKRFYELEDGFNKLLSIILVGQPELGNRLDERNPRVREIVQRCEVVKLRPLNDHLEQYLAHRFKLAGVDITQLMDAAAFQALRAKLTGQGFSALYPLAVHNVLTAALNEAADLGIDAVTSDLIKGV